MLADDALPSDPTRARLEARLEARHAAGTEDFKRVVGYAPGLTFLTYSLVGSAVTPPGRTLTKIDGLVWALGAYVEKKGRESLTVYRLDT